jgi:orotidine-5'-phosphate decarboxylase
MYDGKLHDIPNTMTLAIDIIAKEGLAMTTIHASSGVDAMLDVVAARGNTKILAVTVLTSIDTKECEIIYGMSAGAKVLLLARLAKLAGVQGIVCSAEEVGYLKARRELEGLIYVVPAIRLPEDLKDDQKRTGTPFEAAKNGADFEVVGRSITGKDNPVAAAKEVADQIEAGLAAREAS